MKVDVNLIKRAIERAVIVLIKMEEEDEEFSSFSVTRVRR